MGEAASSVYVKSNIKKEILHEEQPLGCPLKDSQHGQQGQGEEQKTTVTLEGEQFQDLLKSGRG